MNSSARRPTRRRADERTRVARRFTAAREARAKKREERNGDCDLCNIIGRYSSHESLTRVPPRRRKSACAGRVRVYRTRLQASASTTLPRFERFVIVHEVDAIACNCGTTRCARPGHRRNFGEIFATATQSRGELFTALPWFVPRRQQWAKRNAVKHIDCIAVRFVPPRAKRDHLTFRIL
jgi:hypothetical protein